MYFAENGRIGTFDGEAPYGAIVISAEQYQAALSGMLSGQEVVVADGELLIRNPAPSPEHTWEDGEWVAPSITDTTSPAEGTLCPTCNGSGVVPE